MAKYSKKRVAFICSLIKKDSYTVSEICSKSGISESTYYEWIDSKPEFSEAIKEAQDQFDKLIVAEAKKSMMKKIVGYSVKETKTVSVDSGKKDEEGNTIPKIKERTTTDKHFQPDTGMIIFALCNKDPENFKNKQSAELTGPGGKPLNPSIKIEIINSADQVIKDDTGS